MRKILTLLILCCGSALFAQNYQIGDLYTAPDGSQGIVYYLHPDGSGGWMVALNDASLGCPWGTETDVPGLTNHTDSYFFIHLLSDTAGYTNTQAIRISQNNDPSYAAGMVDFDNGWVLPSFAQVSMLYAHLPFVSNAILAAGGSDLSIDLYWCSEEWDSTSAWVFNFNLGYFNVQNKTTSWSVRAVRSFSYEEPQPELSYSWNTGDTTPDITVTPTQTTTYTVTVTSSGGCADTATHSVVVYSGEPQTFYDEVCQGEAYDGNGFSLTASETSEPGAHTYTRIENLGSCTVTHTLELMVNPLPHGEFEKTACGSYEWNGLTYTQSGDYTVAYPIPGGCDSVVTLHLTISAQPEATITITADTICEGEEVTLHTEVVVTPSDVLHVPPVAIGDILCTDNSIVKPSAWPVEGKTAMGVVFYVDNTGEHGWAVHLQDQGSNLGWGGSGIDIPDLPNHGSIDDRFMDLEGYSNTQIIRAAGDASTYPAAWAVDFDNGWYLPATGQLRVLLSTIAFVNVTLDIVEGQQFPMDYFFNYWSSTESNGTYADYMHNNGMGGTVKWWPSSVRSVRSF